MQQSGDMVTDFDIIIAGILSGITSEIGGAGMLISLPMLIGLGLPPLVANGTNRIGTMMLYSFAWVEHRKHRKMEYSQVIILGIPVIIGALTGALLAVNMSQAFMQWSILILIVGVSLFTAFASDLKSKPEATTTPEQQLDARGVVLLFGVGLYCGYMQSGMSFLMYYVLVSLMNTQQEMANSIRHFLSMAVTPVSLIIFGLFGHINWIAGIYLALGSAIGGWIGALLLNHLPLPLNKANILISLTVSIVYVVYFMWKHWGTVYFL